RRDLDLPRPGGVDGRVLRSPDDRDAQRIGQCRRNPHRLHAADEPRPTSRDHPGDHGGGRRRSGAQLAPDPRRSRPQTNRRDSTMDAITATESNGSPQPVEEARTRNVGRIEEIQGVVVEATFPDRLPEINHAITIARPAAAAEEEAPGISTEAGGDVLVCEVQQHLGDDRVRAVAMDRTDGLSRGAEVIDTGGPITVPVGEATLGRIFNLLGEPIDLGEELPPNLERRGIHQEAPSVTDLTPSTEMFETGIKVID